MNLSPLDWLIVATTLLFLIASVQLARKLMRSVADFLAAGRSAGRYLITVSSGLAGLGAITIVAEMEMNLLAGFSMAWWGLTMSVVVLLVYVSGWVRYRFRQTRVLTLAQFFEQRYSRNFRIFAGILCFVSGLINFGIFPAVGARFFIYFCGLPQSLDLFGLSVGTFPLLMIGLLSLSLYFVFNGGQVAVIITDFFQGLFVNLVFLGLFFYFALTVDWGVIFEALSAAPEDASMLNPYKTSNMRDFNFWYFLIGVIGFIYNQMSWQGTQAYNVSATSAHEAKMSAVLDGWRGFPKGVLFLLLPIITYTVLNHDSFNTVAESVTATLAPIDSEPIRNQLRVPLVLTHILPKGLMGAFAAVMLAAFISTHDTYLHSWASVLVQDVVMPFRKKPFTPEQHLKVLRLAVIFVAVFIFLFSLLFKQSEYIHLFFAITGAIFVGGAGAVIIGGLYWDRGTARGAWAALITGSGISIAGIVIHQLADDFFINGQWFWLLSMVGASTAYVLGSLLGPKNTVDMDKLLHRGAYEIEEEHKVVGAPERGYRLLFITSEFTRGDKFIYILNYVWTLGWFLTFVIGTIYNLTHDVSDEAWFRFWMIYLVIYMTAATAAFVWMTIGGFRDLKTMIGRLRTMERDHADDGFVER
ncbi:MAG: sodium:solute symporter [Acidobacteriota bacterium]|nr:sodium:solute symporter [Acidobacteriota bacterium]